MGIREFHCLEERNLWATGDSAQVSRVFGDIHNDNIRKRKNSIDTSERSLAIRCCFRCVSARDVTTTKSAVVRLKDETISPANRTNIYTNKEFRYTRSR